MPALTQSDVGSDKLQSILGVFDLRRGTVLADADFRNLELWAEDEETRTKQETSADDGATDDFELDDSIRYSPVSLHSSMSDLWDWLRCRRFYRIEGDKFQFVRTVSTNRNSVSQMCLHDGKPYIIKRIPLRQPEDLIRAADHFNNLRNYDHPHVLFAFKAAIGNSPTWTDWTRTEVRMVLPFTPGHLLSVELEDREKNKFHLHPRRIVRLVREILDGLFEIHSHSNGDAHRNIRPGTIMIREPDDWPLILDLDCCTPAVVMTNDAQEMQNIIDISENITSLFYRAPETFDIRPESVIDERTDIWAMGCLLFALCFFRSPFQPVDVSDPPPKNFPRFEETKEAILSLTTEKFLDEFVPADSPYSRDLHQYMARLLTADLINRPTTEQAIRELDDLIAGMGGPDQPICVKYPWINPTADGMAADVLQNRLKDPILLDFDQIHPSPHKHLEGASANQQ